MVALTVIGMIKGLPARQNNAISEGSSFSIQCELVGQQEMYQINMWPESISSKEMWRLDIKKNISTSLYIGLQRADKPKRTSEIRP